MATYAVGDIQGCFRAFERLLDEIAFNPGVDTLWLVGDVVNRGPESLATLRWIYHHQDCVQMVLGNHDLHLLALAAGVGKMRTADTLQELLDAPDARHLCDYLRAQALMIAHPGYAMVHAGLLPDWTISKALDLANEVEHPLRRSNDGLFFSQMYGNEPVSWDDCLQGFDRLRVIINAMTRLRVMTPQGAMDLTYKGHPKKVPAGFIPWFQCPWRHSVDTVIVCGHWSALGLWQGDGILAMDTGCLWGGSLSALCLETRQVFSVSCAV